MLKHCLSASIFKVLVAFAQITGGVLPDAQQSSTVFEESRDIIVRHVQRYLVDAVRQSPYYAISVDEKDAMIIIVITFLDKSRQKAWAPLAYKHLAGLEAADLFQAIMDSLEEHGLDPKNLIAFCADGASVMGTHKALSDPRDGNNVARRLQARVGHPLLVQHCSPHRLQLAIETAFHSEEYLQEMEKRIRSLFKHLYRDTHLYGGMI